MAGICKEMITKGNRGSGMFGLQRAVRRYSNKLHPAHVPELSVKIRSSAPLPQDLTETAQGDSNIFIGPVSMAQSPNIAAQTAVSESPYPAGPRLGESKTSTTFIL
jgi:hypothetical protein